MVGDVHGDIEGFRHAIATERFIIQLGDLVDHGPDSAAVLQLMQNILRKHKGMFVLGNHDRKLARLLEGRQVHYDQALETTLCQIRSFPYENFGSDVYHMIAGAPVWQRINQTFFLHASFHTLMLTIPPPETGIGKLSAPVSRALFGETTGQLQKDGYPERRLNWIHSVPQGMTVYVGHDQRSTDGRPHLKEGRLGGKTIFMDLGAGKGGHLGWVDINDF